jgi:hypothetical protein
MKAKKALKRLAKIETLISDLTERYSKGALQIREALQDAKTAFGRVKEAVSLQASSGTVKKGALARKKNAAKKPGKSSTALTASAPAPKTKRPNFSAAQREAAAERMRQRWAAKKQAVTEAAAQIRTEAAAMGK